MVGIACPRQAGKEAQEERPGEEMDPRKPCEVSEVSGGGAAPRWKENEEEASPPDHPLHLAYGEVRVVQVLEGVLAEAGIEALPRKGQSSGVADHRQHAPPGEFPAAGRGRGLMTRVAVESHEEV
jgi:hypothetical protein